MKQLFTVFFFYFSFYFSFSQTTFPWNGTYGGAGASRTYTTTVSGTTMSATIVNSENVFTDSSPLYIAAGGVPPGSSCSGISATNQGMLIYTDWTTNTTKTVTVTITFSPAVVGPVDFSLFDINDDGFGSWLDKIVVSGTNSAGAAVNCSKVGTLCIETGGSVTGNNTPILTLNSGQSTACTCWGNNRVNVGSASDCISNVVIKYQSGNTNYNNPKQYVIISDLKANIPFAVAAPTSITGTTTICAGASTTLSVVGGSASSQWYTGSCGGTLVGTGTAITVSPSSTTTYYVRNGSSSCSPASACISATVTVNPVPPTPTISANGPTSICPGNSVILTSSAASGNTWNTGATTQSITVSTAGTYTVTNTASGCSATSAGTTITLNSATSISNKTSSICSGNTYTLTPSGSDNVVSGTTYTWTNVANSSISGASNGTTQNSFVQTLTNTSQIPQTITYTVTPTANGCSGAPFTLTITVDAPLNGGTVSNDQTICSGDTPSLLTNTQSPSGGNGLGLANTVQIGSQIWMNTNLDALNYTDGQLIGTDFTIASGAYTWYNNDQPTYGVYAPLYNWFAVNTNKLCPNGWKVPTNADWLSLMNFVGTNEGNKLKSCRQVSSPLGGSCAVNALPRWDSHVSQYGTDAVGFKALPAGRKEIANFLYTGTRATFWSADNFTPGINGSSYYVNLAYNLGTAEFTDFTSYYTSSRWGLSVRCMASNPTNVNTSYTYAWQQDPGCTGNWTTISGATSLTYQPGALTQTTCFRRVTTDACGTVYSNTITITVNPKPVISNVTNSICSGTAFNATPTNGSGVNNNNIVPSGTTFSWTVSNNANVTGQSAQNNQTTISQTLTNTSTTSQIVVYTVTPTSGSCAGAPFTVTVTVNPNPTTPTISVNGPTTFCSGGSVTLSSSSANGNTWSTGETTQSITVSTAGNYTVTITSNGCTSTASNATTVTINPTPSTPTISASGPTTFCSGGSVTLTSSSATGNTWSTGETTQSITVSTAGNYTVTTTSNGCTSPASNATLVTINPTPSTPTISANGPTTFCSGGSVTLTSSSATGNTWSTGETTQSITVSTAGNYTVTTTSNGCTSAASNATTVTINPTPSTPTISASGPTTFCSGGTVTLTSSSATGNTWSTGENTQSITVSTAGNYTVTTTSNGCTSPASNATLVTINPTPSTPTISANGPTTFCSGGSVTLSSSSATGNTWSTGETTQSITVSIAGTYTVSTTDANSCTSAIASISVFINPTVNTNFTQVGAICSGGSFTLPTTSTNGINGTWSPAINQNSTTTYTFTPNTGQCGTSTTMTITVNPSVTPTFTQVAPICIPGTLNALPTTSNNGITGSWSPSINNTSTTTYTFTPSISPGADCDQAAYICGTSTSYFVNNLNGPGANAEEPEAGSCMDVFGPDEQNSAWFTFSAATSGNLTFDIIPSVLNDDIDFILYELNTDNPCGARTVIRCNSAACLGNTGLSMTDLDISEDPNCDPGENAYCQYVQATAGSKYALLVNNCNTNQSFTLQFNNGIPNPITFSPPNSTSNYFNATTCSGQCASEVTMTIQVNSPTSSITNQSICDSQLPFSWNGLTFSSAGSQTATLIAANGCDSLATLNLTVNPNPTVSSLITNVNCFGSNTGAVNYSLTTGIAPFTVNPSPINLAAGNYIFLITDANGCTVNDIISISEPLNALTASITSVNTSCNGLNDGTVDLTVSGGTLPYSFSWNNGATSEDINNLSAGNYIVTITDANGCIFNTNTTVNNSSPTTPTISVNGPTTFCAGGNVILSSSSLSGNTWSTGETTQSITITTSGSYSVIVDSLGCSVSSASQTIVVNPAPTTPTISANGPTTFCAGGSVTLTSSSITGNTWSTGETTQSIIVSTSGNYSVTVDSAGCSATSSTISIIVNPNPTTPTITASQTTICAGQTATLTSSVVNGNSWSTNETTQSIAVSSSGTYLLFVSDANGCVSPSTSVTITINPLPSTPTISANGPTTFCAGGSVTLTSSVASGNTWNTAETTQSIIVSTSGTYTVFYTDLNGCISPSASISIVVNPSPTTPTITANGPTSFCVGGSVTLTSSSITGNTWSTGETTQSIIVSTSGNYSVTVDSAGCSATSSTISITVNPNPTTPTITASQTTICAGQTATLTSSVINGNSWSTNETTQSIAVSSSGTYLLFVSDANGCVSPSTSVTITVNPLPSTPTISANGPTTFCSGGNVTLTSSSTTGNTWSTGETTQSIIVTTSGTYTLTYIDGNGCVSTFASQVVTVNTTPTSPTITPSDPTTFCVGDSVILTSSASTGNTWSTGATTPSITVLTAGTYTVTVGNLGCSATSASVVVTLNPLPTTPTITASQTSICVGQSSTLTSSVTTGNTWSTGATTNSISVSTAGTYTLTVTDGNGCVSPIASVIITATPTPTAPTISASGPTTFCVGGSVTLSSNIATGNTWSNGATTQSITVTNSGTYSVLYTNSAGCISSTASQIVTVNPLPTTPTISASGPLTICSGTTITLTSSASTGNTWSNGATTQSITVGTAGTYTVLVTTSGCSVASNSLTITVSSAPITPTITSTATSLCPGQTATLTSSAAIGNTWSTGATTQSITVSNTGTYSVFYTNANGCNSANASTTITVTAPPTITVNSATICQGQNATLTANASATGGSYTWSPGGNTTSTLTVSPNSTTTYNVIYQLNGCTSTPVSGTVTVNATPNITFIANQVSGCVPLTVNFNNTTIGNPTNCQWSFSNGASVIGCQSSYTFTNPGCYDVTLTNTVGGCTVSQTLTDYICLSSPPNASFSTNPSEFTSNSQNVTFFNNSTGATSYLWNFGDGFTSTDENPAHLFTNTQGGYTISLTATNSLGCTDIYQIGIGYVAGVEYYIPNTFTPDGDGYNQTFQPVFTSGYDPFNFQMMIFNRWGELIFESYDASKGWDGSYGIDGRAVQDGIYTYKIVFKNPKVDERIIVTGHITLIR